MLVKVQLDAPWDSASTVDLDEIGRFMALAVEWWEPDGKFRTVHKFNAARLGYILERIGEAFQYNDDSFGFTHPRYRLRRRFSG